MNNHKISLLLASALLFCPLLVLADSPDAERETHRPLAEHIFQRMRLSDTDATERLTRATISYLVALESILQERQTTLDAIEAADDDPETEEARIIAAYEQAKSAYMPLKKAYVKQLRADLVPYHIERVKDGLTHDALPNLHAMYLEMVPDLTPSEKAHILGLLVEGRENAMLAVSSRGQKQWFDKYRGIINNFIAAQGHDFATLSKAWDEANAEE